MPAEQNPIASVPAGRVSAWWRWAVVLVPGFVFYFAPLPLFNPGQRHLLAIFVASVISLVAQPMPMGVSLIVATTVIGITGAVPAAKALSGFSNATVWLIFTAFLFSRAVSGTGFGLRVAYLFIRRFGKGALSLGYSVSAANLVLAPFIPSDTARGGGIVYPVVRSLATAFDSEPGPTARRLGAYLVLVAFHSNYTVSAMFLTSMAANPLMAEFARKIAHVDITWGWWALGAIVPGLLALTLIPHVMMRLHPPEIRTTPSAPAMADEQLRRMGPMTRNERWLVGVMLCVMVGWVTSPLHGAPNAFVALAGVSGILLCRILTWSDLLAEGKAWDALIWFGALLTMADALNDTGVIRVVSNAVISHMNGWPWPAAFVVLMLTYFYVHYGFASMTAHATALYPAFIGAAVLAGAPPLMAALALGYFSNINSCTTHYGTGSAPVFFGAGYVGQGVWWKIGFIMSLLNIAIWLGVGSIWWKALGLW